MAADNNQEWCRLCLIWLSVESRFSACAISPRLCTHPTMWNYVLAVFSAHSGWLPILTVWHRASYQQPDGRSLSVKLLPKEIPCSLLHPYEQGTNNKYSTKLMPQHWISSVIWARKSVSLLTMIARLSFYSSVSLWRFTVLTQCLCTVFFSINCQDQ